MSREVTPWYRTYKILRLQGSLVATQECLRQEAAAMADWQTSIDATAAKHRRESALLGTMESQLGSAVDEVRARRDIKYQTQITSNLENRLARLNKDLTKEKMSWSRIKDECRLNLDRDLAAVEILIQRAASGDHQSDQSD